MGDVNDDDYCGIDDIVSISENFGESCGNMTDIPNNEWFNWELRHHDLEIDGYIGIQDSVIASEHFGDQEP
jgi:hypothetical protein